MTRSLVSGYNREAIGVTCTATNGERRITFNVRRNQDVIAHLDGLADGPWKVQAMSTPDSILADLNGRDGVKAQVNTPERLVAAKRPDLVLGQFIGGKSSESQRLYRKGIR
jgi:hypothetical protein